MGRQTSRRFQPSSNVWRSYRSYPGQSIAAPLDPYYTVFVISCAFFALPICSETQLAPVGEREFMDFHPALHLGDESRRPRPSKKCSAFGKSRKARQRERFILILWTVIVQSL